MSGGRAKKEKEITDLVNSSEAVAAMLGEYISAKFGEVSGHVVGRGNRAQQRLQKAFKQAGSAAKPAHLVQHVGQVCSEHDDLQDVRVKFGLV